MDVSQRALQANGNLFSKFRIFFLFLAENQKIFKRIARREFWSNCNCYISMNSSQQALQTNDIQIFKILAEKLKKIQTNGEAWILIGLQCVYISMDSTQQALQTNGTIFFKFQFYFQIIDQKPKNIQTALILIKVKCIIYKWILTRQALKTNGKLFQISESFFKLVTNF